MLIYLIGLRGSGKTTIAVVLSKHLDMPFIDLDDRIALSESMPIPEIFRLHGEEHFRSVENRELERLSQQSNAVIATGGGSVIRAENRSLMKNTGKCIYLKCLPQTLFERIAGDPNRPALTKQNLREEIDTIYEQRKDFYEELAELTIDTGKLTVEQAAKAIAEHVKGR